MDENPTRRPVRWPWLALAFAIATTALWISRCGGDGRTEYDEQDLAQARARWKADGPASYTMEIDLRGVRRAHHVVEVRDGKVVSMTTDGEPVPERVWPAWSVEGLFTILDEELSYAKERAANGEQAPTLLAAFDPKTGAPMSFLRHEQGATRGLEWVVTRLDPTP